MKCIPVLVGAALLLSGCKTLPDYSDITSPSLRFRIHYEKPGLGTPMVEIATSQVTMASRCVYVNEPFGVAVSVADPEGVKSISIGVSQFPFDAVKPRTTKDDIYAIPSPSQPTDGATPNPGAEPDSALVRLAYTPDKVFDNANLFVTYDFKAKTRASLQGTARNWGNTNALSQVYHFYVEKAEPGDPKKQPGMSCAVL